MEAEIVVPEISQQKENEEKQVHEDSDYEKFHDKISTELISTTVQKPDTKVENSPAKRSDATGLPTVAETAERMSSEKVEVATSESFTQEEIVISTVVENKDKKHIEGDFCETPSKPNVVTLVNGVDYDASEMLEVKVEDTKEEKSHQSVLLSSQTSAVEAKKPKDQIGHEVEKFEISKDALPQIAQDDNLNSSSVKETVVEKGFWTVAEHESLNWTTNLIDEEQNTVETEIMKEEDQKEIIKIRSLLFKQDSLDPIRILQNIEQDEGFDKKYFEAVDASRDIGEADLEYEKPKDVRISIKKATVESTSREEQKNCNEISLEPINPTEGKNYTSENMDRKNSSTSETLIPVSREKCETEDDGTAITSQKLSSKLPEDTKSVADEMTEQEKSICETFDYVSHEGETEDTELRITSTDVLEEEKFETLKKSNIPTPEDEIQISIDNMDNERPKDACYTENNERNLPDAEAEGRYLVQPHHLLSESQTTFNLGNVTEFVKDKTKHRVEKETNFVEEPAESESQTILKFENGAEFVEVKIEDQVELKETKFVEEPREIVCPVPQECEPRTVDQKEKVLIERSTFQTISESIDEENSKTDGIDCEEVSHQPEPKDDKDSSQKSQNLPYIKEEFASKFEQSEKTDQLHEVQDTEDQALNMVSLHDEKLDQDLKCPEKEVPVIPLLVQASTEETTDKQEELNEQLVLRSNKKDMEMNPRQATATSEAEDAGEKQMQGQREGEAYEGSLQQEEAGKVKFVKDNIQDHAKQKETIFNEVPAETNSSQPDYEFRLTDTKEEELLAEQDDLETSLQAIDERSSKNDEISCEEISHEPVPQDTEEISEEALRSLEEKIGIEIENIERTSQLHKGVQNFDIEEEVPNVITSQDRKLDQDFKCPEREIKVISSDIQASTEETTDKLKHEELNGLFVLNYNQKELGTTHSPIAVTLEAEDVGEKEMQRKAENEPYTTLLTDVVSLQQDAGSMKFLKEKVEDNFEQKETTCIEETAENNSSAAQEYEPRSTDMSLELTEQDNLKSRLHEINDESVKKDEITCEDISHQLLPPDIQERSENASVLHSPEEIVEIEIKNSETTDRADEEVQNFDTKAEALNVISLHDKKLDQIFRYPEAETSVISSTIQALIGETVDKSKKQEEPNEQFVSEANGKDLETIPRPTTVTLEISSMIQVSTEEMVQKPKQEELNEQFMLNTNGKELDTIPRPTTVTLEAEDVGDKELQGELKTESYATQSTKEPSLSREEAGTQKLVEDKIEDHVERKETIFIEEPEETNILLPQEYEHGSTDMSDRKLTEQRHLESSSDTIDEESMKKNEVSCETISHQPVPKDTEETSGKDLNLHSLEENFEIKIQSFEKSRQLHEGVQNFDNEDEALNLISLHEKKLDQDVQYSEREVNVTSSVIQASWEETIDKLEQEELNGQFELISNAKDLETISRPNTVTLDAQDMGEKEVQGNQEDASYATLPTDEMLLQQGAAGNKRIVEVNIEDHLEQKETTVIEKTAEIISSEPHEHEPRENDMTEKEINGQGNLESSWQAINEGSMEKDEIDSEETSHQPVPQDTEENFERALNLHSPGQELKIGTWNSGQIGHTDEGVQNFALSSTSLHDKEPDQDFQCPGREVAIISSTMQAATEETADSKQGESNELFLLNSNEKDLETISTPTTVTLESEDVAEKEVQGIEEPAETNSLVPQEYEPRSTDVREEELTAQSILESSSHAVHEECLKKNELLSYEGIVHQPVPPDTEENSEKVLSLHPPKENFEIENSEKNGQLHEEAQNFDNNEEALNVICFDVKKLDQDLQCPEREASAISSTIQASTEPMVDKARHEQLDEQFLLISNEKDLKTIPLSIIVTLEDEDVGQKETQGNQADPSNASLATQETQQEAAGSKTYVEGNIEDCLARKETTFIEEPAKIISSAPQEYEPRYCDVPIEQGSLQTNSQGNDKESKETNEIACEEISHQPVPQDTEESSEKTHNLYALEEKDEVETENSEKTGPLHEATQNFHAESQALNVIHLHNKKQDQGFQYPEGETALVSSASQASTQEMVDEAKLEELNGECALVSDQMNLETIPRSTIVNLEGEDVIEKEVQVNQEDASHATLPIEESPSHGEEAENQKGDNVTTVAPEENTQPFMTGTGFTCSVRSVENEDLHEVEKDDGSHISQAPLSNILHKDGRSCQMDEETDGLSGDGIINYEDGAHIKNHDGNTTQEAVITRGTLEISIKNQGIEGFKEEKEQKVDFDKQNLEAKSPSEESMEKRYDVFSLTQERQESLEKEEGKKQDNIEEIKSLNIKRIDTQVYLGCDNGGDFDDSKHLDGHAQETIYPDTNDYVTQEERKDVKFFHIPIAESQPQINIDLARAEQSVGFSESASEEMNVVNTKSKEVKDEMEESKQDIGLDSSSTRSCQVEVILTKNHQKSEEASGSSSEEHTENKSNKFDQGKELLSYSEEVREHEVTLANDEQEITPEMGTQKQKDPSTGAMQEESSEHLVKNEGTVSCLPFSIQDSGIETSQEPIKKLVQDPNVEIQEHTQDTPEMEFKKKEDLSKNALETENSEKPDENEMDNIPSNIHESAVEILQGHADRLEDCSMMKLEKDIIEETTTDEDSSIMEVGKKEEPVVEVIQEESKKKHIERETITHISSATQDSIEGPSQGHADQLSESSKVEIQEEMIDNYPSVQHTPEMKANVQEDLTEVKKYTNEDLLKNKAGDVTTNNDAVGDISKEHIMSPEASSSAELQEGVPTETVHDFQLVDNKRQEDPSAQTLYKQSSMELLKNRKCQDIPSADQDTTLEVLTEPAEVQEQSQLVLQKETQEQKTAAEYVPHEKDEKQKRIFENLVKKDIVDANQTSSFKYLEEIPEKKVSVQEISEAENNEHDSSATQDSVGGVLQEYLDSQNECSKVKLQQEVQDTQQMGGKNQEDRFLELKMEIYEGLECDNHKHEVPQELLRSIVTEKGSTESERIGMDGEEQVKSTERDAREKTSLIIASGNINIKPRNEGDYNLPASEFSADTVVEKDETQPGIQEKEVKLDSMRQNHEATDPCKNEKQVSKEEPAHVNVQEESTVDVQTETDKQEGTGPKYQTETDKQEGTGSEMDSVEVTQQAEDVMPKEDFEVVPNENQNIDGHDKLQSVAAEDEESKKLSETMETDTCEEPKEAEERQEIAPQFETVSEQNENENSRPDLSAHVELVETRDEITVEQAEILQTDEDFSERILIPKDSHEDSAPESVDIQQRKTEADIQSQVRDTEQASIQVIQQDEDIMPKEASDFVPKDDRNIDCNIKREPVTAEYHEGKQLSETKERHAHEETKDAEERLEIAPGETVSEYKENEESIPDQSANVEPLESHNQITVGTVEILKIGEEFSEQIESRKDYHEESASELVELEEKQIQVNLQIEARDMQEVGLEQGQIEKELQSKEEVKEEEAGVEVMTREVSVDLEQAPCALSMKQFLPIIDEGGHETLKADEIILPHEATDTEPESEILQQTKYFENAADLTEENKHYISDAVEHTDGNNPNKEGDPDDYANIKFETQDSTKEILKKELDDKPVGTSSHVLDEQISETNICKNVEIQGLPDNKTFHASAADSMAHKVLQVETQKLQEVPTLVTELQHHETRKAYMNYESPKEDLSQRQSTIMKETTDDNNKEEKAKDATISEGEKATDDNLFSSLEMSDSMNRSSVKDVGNEIPPEPIKTADENEKLSLDSQIPTDAKHTLQEASSVTETHKDDEIREGKVHRGHELTYSETTEGITGSDSSVKTNILEKEIELERHVASSNKEGESGEDQEEMKLSEIAPNITGRPHVESIQQFATAEKEIQTRDESTDMITVREVSTETQTSDFQKAPGKEKNEMVEQLMVEERSAGIENDSPDESIASVKTDIEHGKKIEEKDEEQKHVEFTHNAPIIAEASKDADQKPHKKHNILSSVGSKVKHSLGKVKKAITGKSSHDKSQPPQAKD